MKKMLLPLFVATIAAACSAEVVQPVNPANVQGPVAAPAPAELFLLRGNGEVDQLRIGQKFGVALREHPSVGWTWEIAAVPDLVRADGVIEPDLSDVAPGGDVGDKTFRFVAAHPGAGAIRFIHKFRGEPREDIIFRVLIAS